MLKSSSITERRDWRKEWKSSNSNMVLQLGNTLNRDWKSYGFIDWEND